MAFAPPHPALAGLVGPYCGYDEHTVAPLRRREVATASVTIIVGFAPTRVSSPRDAGYAPSVTTSFVAGLHDGPAIVEHDGYQSGVQIDLTPLGAYTLLGLPAAEIADHVVHLADLPGWDVDRLTDRLVAAPDWATRFAHLDALLLRRRGRGRRGDAADRPGVRRSRPHRARPRGQPVVVRLPPAAGVRPRPDQPSCAAR
jgi:hypothetical protein